MESIKCRSPLLHIKRNFSILTVFALALIVLAACPDGNDNGSDKDSCAEGHDWGEWETIADIDTSVCANNSSHARVRFITVEAMAGYLSQRPANTAASPYHIVLILAAPPRVYNAILSNKYVSLDFTGSTFAGIGYEAFYNCTLFTEIIIPDSVTSIANRAFRNCTSLIRVTFQGVISSQDFSSEAFGTQEDSASYIGDLRDKYLAGGPGTYIRARGGTTWTKQP